jgi:hypothetical protein
MSASLPAGLVKRGIVSVTDNLQPGDQISIGKSFNRIFRTEIEERIFKKEPKGCDAAAAGVNVPSRSK